MSRGPGVAQRAIKTALRDDLLLSRAGGRQVWLSVAEIAEATGLSRQSCSRAAHRLEDGGWVELQQRPVSVWSASLEKANPDHPSPHVSRYVLMVRANLGVLQRALSERALREVTELRREVDLLEQVGEVLRSSKAGRDRRTRLEAAGLPQRFQGLDAAEVDRRSQSAHGRLRRTIEQFNPWSNGLR